MVHKIGGTAITKFIMKLRGFDKELNTKLRIVLRIPAIEIGHEAEEVTIRKIVITASLYENISSHSKVIPESTYTV